MALKNPLYRGSQLSADFTEPFKAMLINSKVESLNEPEEIIPAHVETLFGNEFHSTLIIEHVSYYNDK